MELLFYNYLIAGICHLSDIVVTCNFYIKCTRSRHSIKRAGSFTDGQFFCFVIPFQGNCRIPSFLVVVVVAFILIEEELGILTGINHNFEIIIIILIGILNVGTKRNDATLSYIYG